MCQICVLIGKAVIGTIYLILIIGLICYYFDYKKLGLILILISVFLLLKLEYNKSKIYNTSKC